jgi:hypothetical protein
MIRLPTPSLFNTAVTVGKPKMKIVKRLRMKLKKNTLREKKSTSDFQCENMKTVQTKSGHSFLSNGRVENVHFKQGGVNFQMFV